MVTPGFSGSLQDHEILFWAKWDPCLGPHSSLGRPPCQPCHHRFTSQCPLLHPGAQRTGTPPQCPAQSPTKCCQQATPFIFIRVIIVLSRGKGKNSALPPAEHVLLIFLLSVSRLREGICQPSPRDRRKVLTSERKSHPSQTLHRRGWRLKFSTKRGHS